MTPPRALVVDDDPDMRGVLADVLADEGFTSLQAANGQEALELIEAGLPQVVFLDMRMPVMDGWQFAAELRRRHDRKVPIVVVTAAQDAERYRREVSAEGCLSKPFDIDEVAVVLQEVLGRPAAR